MKPYINIAKRQVLIHSALIGSFHLYHINNYGLVSNRRTGSISFAENRVEACRAMDTAFSGFRAVNGMDHMRFPSAKSQIEMIWQMGMEQWKKKRSTSHIIRNT